MRLLSKQEINARKATEKKQQIDEGVKLARKVDALRELRTQEDAVLQKFRAETVATINDEIKTLSERRISLSDEVVLLEWRRADALKPLEKETAELEVRRAGLQLLDDEVKNATKELHTYDKKLDVRAKRIETDREDVDQQLRDTEAARKDAADHLSESEKALEKAKSIETQAVERYDLLVAELSQRETALLGRERDILDKEKTNAERERALNDRERLINDRYATLLRTEQHIYGRRK